MKTIVEALMSKTKQTYKPVAHDPFLIRKSIFFAGLAAGLFSGYFLSSWIWGIACYFVAVTTADLFAHFVLAKRSSDYIDQKLLASNEEISPGDLDRFHDSRRNIRVFSLLAAFASQAVLLSSEVFCLVYAGMSFVLVLVTKFVLKVRGPVWIRREDKKLHSFSYEDERSREMDIGTLTGAGSYGILRTRD